MSDVQEYPEVFQEVRGALNPGRLKLQSNSVTFKNIKTGKVDQYQSSDIEAVHWLKRARGNCLKMLLNNGTIHRYDGFKEMEFERLASFVSKYYNSELEKVDIAMKGWNWGQADFVANALNFKIDNHLAFEIPLGNVSHSTNTKNEVTLEFHQNDDAAVSLTELRFHIPTDPNTEVDTVAEFYEKVLAKADIIQATGDAVVTFTEVQCLTPRGRYDIKLYPTFLQLHGKTFDYKVPYTTVLRLFLLPHKDSRQMFFVVSLDPPIKQGQTRYHFLILLFNKEDEMTVELGMTEEELKEKYDGKLNPEMHGLEYEVVSKIFKAITQRKITVPGSFEGQQGTRCVSCSYKAATGLLYPLERGFIFVHKPPLHIRFDEINCVNFARGSGNTRSFDFEIETLSSSVYHFVGIEKDEYGKLFDFVSSKKLRVKNIDKNKSGKGANAGTGAMSGSDEEGGDHDAYLERMKAEGKQRQDDDEDDDTDSSDESFNPGESGSEVAEEYDSNPPTTDSEDSDEESDSEPSEAKKARKEQKQKEKAEKNEKKKAKEKKRSKSAKTVSEGGKRKSKKKSKREKGQPKRPQSSYFLWLNENREKIKEDNPGISITEVSKKAGELWKKVTDKTKWEKLAEEAKKDYVKAMEQWNNREISEGGSDEGDGKDSSPKKSKKSNSSPSKKANESRAGAGVAYKSKEFISSSDTSGEDKPKKKKLRKDGSESEKELPSEPDEATPNTSEDSGHSGKSGSESGSD
ncbi:FACT complex subunit SSRP1 [Patella vulgata]|uniref:FACT complex subunit SSRP1 n=1 Tax=Patella vulgata TaxID=6465 RepID=UPI00217FA496|nr:FACT complex subunit SSRP1 [Patella vulgata]